MATRDVPERHPIVTAALGASGSVRTYEPTADTTGELEAVVAAGLTKVCIDTPPLTVTVEAPGITVAEAREHALGIYRDVWRDDMAKSGAAVGFAAPFAAERSPDA